MALCLGLEYKNGFRNTSFPSACRRFIAAAAKSSKGFGGVHKQDDKKYKHDQAASNNRRDFKEAASASTTHRPVKPEEAARGKLDYVQVADWGDGERSKLGELRLVSHVKQYEGGANTIAGTAASSCSSSSSNDGGRPRPFHMQLADQLKMAEARGALAVAGPPPPAVTEWSFREVRYVQYLTDQLEVHDALEAALLEATSSVINSRADASRTSSTQPTELAAAPLLPEQDAVHALLHMMPRRLGLERSAAIRQDLSAMRATANLAAASDADAESAAAAGRGAANLELEVEAGTPSGTPLAHAGVGVMLSEVIPSPALPCSDYKRTAGPMARSYAQVLRRLGRIAAVSGDKQERQSSALRLLAHAAVLHMVAQAVWVRLGATATERLALLQRRAAATYHDYPPEVIDPRVSLSRALDAAGEHLGSPVARQVVFDEVAGAMQKTGLLLSALAHRD